MTVRRTGLRVVIIAAVVLIVGIAVAALAMRHLWFGKAGGPVQAVNAPADVVARGKYLAEAADCAACHTAPGGAPFAGGLPMQSGFGTIYATNITIPTTALAAGARRISGARCTTGSGATERSSIRQCPIRPIAA
jgi:mono/diheme cytochrome c family protein